MKGESKDTISFGTELVQGTQGQTSDGQSVEEVPIKVEEFLLVEDVAYVKMEDPCILAFWHQTSEATEKTKTVHEELHLNTEPNEWDVHWKDYGDSSKEELLQSSLRHKIGENDTRPCYTWQITKWLISEKPVDSCLSDNSLTPRSAISKWCDSTKDEEVQWQREVSGSLKVIATKVPDTYCHHCSEDFSENDDLLRHINEEHLEEDIGYFQCSTCLASFDSKNSIINHLQNINNMCRLCSEYFCKTLDLQLHYEEHEKAHNYACVYCNSRFHDEVQYQRHALQHKENETADSTLHLNNCSRKSKKSVKKRRSLKKPYECVLCPKTYAHKHSLEVHIRKHSQEKILRCNFCPSTFYSKHSFMDHMRMAHSTRNSSLNEIFNTDSSYGAQSKKDLHSDIFT